MKAVMMEQHPGRAVHIRMRILGLAMLPQHLGRDLGIPLHEPEDGIARDVRAGGREVDEGLEARVGFAEDGVAVAGDDLPGSEGGPEVVLDGLVGEGGADGGLHFEDPAEDFLGGEPVRVVRWDGFGGPFG